MLCGVICCICLLLSVDFCVVTTVHERAMQKSPRGEVDHDGVVVLAEPADSDLGGGADSEQPPESAREVRSPLSYIGLHITSGGGSDVRLAFTIVSCLAKSKCCKFAFRSVLEVAGEEVGAVEGIPFGLE